MAHASIIKAIYTTSKVGKGTEEDPVRQVYELWTKDGKKICIVDNYKGTGEFFHGNLNV